MLYSHACIFQKWPKTAQLNILSLGITTISMRIGKSKRILIWLLRLIQTCITHCVKCSKIENFLSEHVLRVCELNWPTLLRFMQSVWTSLYCCSISHPPSPLACHCLSFASFGNLAFMFEGCSIVQSGPTYANLNERVDGRPQMTGPVYLTPDSQQYIVDVWGGRVMMKPDNSKMTCASIRKL